MGCPLKLLLIEDDPDDAALVVEALTASGWDVESKVVGDADGLAQALPNDWDVIVSDYALPQFGAFEALALVRGKGVDLPFIVVSGCIGEEAAIAVMREGAGDCIDKNHLTRLGPALARELKEAENRRARQAAERRLARVAYHDEATDLPNRRFFLDSVTRFLDRSDGARFAIAYFGFERVRLLADTLGQVVGDQAISAVAERLRQLLPADGLLAQVAGDELVCLVPEHAVGRTGWQAWITALLGGFEAAFTVEGMELFVPPVIGMSVCPGDGMQAELLLRNAKAAMQRAQADRKPFALFTAALEKENLQRLYISHRLRGALARGEFDVHFQPKVDLATGEVCGLEALLRWTDRELGPVSPDRFVPIAEQSGEIVAIGEWVVRQVCGEVRRWRDLGLPPIRVAVNVSARQLRHPEFAAVIRCALDDARLPPAALELEVTETDIMADTDLAIALLSEIRSMGVTVAVDDFGTGYSSLAYIKRLPVSTLKVDRSFIVDVLSDSESQAIVEAVVGLAHGLGLCVVAEGVETREHHDWLAQLGCEQAQGYLYSRPLDRQQTLAFLRRHAHRQEALFSGLCPVFPR